MTLRSQPDLGTPLHQPGVDSNRGNELRCRKTFQPSGPDRNEEEEKDQKKPIYCLKIEQIKIFEFFYQMQN